jgi:hypothetical protein
MGRRWNQVPIRNAVVGTDFVHCHNGDECFQITVEDLADSLTGGSGVSDHGLLTGLADDDHPHYLNNARGDARYAPITSTANRLTALESQIVSGAVIPSFLMECADTITNHRIEVRFIEGIGYYLHVNETPETGTAVEGLTMTTGGESPSRALVTLVFEGGFFRFNFETA